MTPATREVLAHLALALSRYEKESARDGVRVPQQVVGLRELLMDCVRSGQGETPLGGSVQPSQDESMNPMLTRREAASALRCSIRTVDRLIAAGSLRAVKVEGSTRVRRADLDRYIAGLDPRASFRDSVIGKDSA